MTIRDTAEFIWDYLKNNAGAADFRALVVGGAANVVEAGDVTIDILNAAVATRRAAASAKILAVSVQDAGEDPQPHRTWQQSVVVRLYDRGRGNRNIRPARISLITTLGDIVGGITAGQESGTLETRYGGRSGHTWDKLYDVEYEAVVFHARIQYQEGN